MHAGGLWAYAISMDLPLKGPVGLISDSHGRLDLMAAAVHELVRKGAVDIVHLGDICDSLAPLLLEDALPIIEGAGIRAVLGNNEYEVLRAHRGRSPNPLGERVMAFLESLPYVITMGSVTFAHSAPLAWPAALRWPLTDGAPPFGSWRIPEGRILFRGHSHSPSVFKVENSSMDAVQIPGEKALMLDRSSRYVITVGAVEQGACALYLPDEDSVRFMRID